MNIGTQMRVQVQPSATAHETRQPAKAKAGHDGMGRRKQEGGWAGAVGGRRERRHARARASVCV